MKLCILWGLFIVALVVEAFGINRLFDWCKEQPSDYFAAGLYFWMVVIGCVLADIVFFVVNAIETLSAVMDRVWH